MPSAKPIARLAQRAAGLLEDWSPWDSKLWNRDELKKLPQQPDRPQSDIPRYQPARGPSERAQALANDPKVWKKYDELVANGLKMGGGSWYNTQPLLDDFVEAVGPEQGLKNYEDYIRMVAASSTGSAVRANARNASYYYVNQGKLPERVSQSEPLPTPYGHKMQQNHLRQARDAEAGQPWDVFKNPKPASFEQNLLGNWRPGTIDKHSTRGPGMLSGDARWLKPSWQENKDSPVRYPQQLHAEGTPLKMMGPMDYADVPNPNEYGLLEEVFQDRARRMGIAPAQYQAGGWIGGGELTGLGSPPDPFLKVLEERVMHTAQARGETPAKVYEDFLHRRKPLLQAAGAGVGTAAIGGGLLGEPMGEPD